MFLPSAFSSKLIGNPHQIFASTFFFVSDESAVLNVIPKHFQKNSSFYEETVMVSKCVWNGTFAAKHVVVVIKLKSTIVWHQYSGVNANLSPYLLCSICVELSYNVFLWFFSLELLQWKCGLAEWRRGQESSSQLLLVLPISACQLLPSQGIHVILFDHIVIQWSMKMNFTVVGS